MDEPYLRLATVLTPYGEVRLYKVCDWYFVIQFNGEFPNGKFLLCLGIEHAITVFDWCAKGLIEEVN